MIRTATPQYLARLFITTEEGGYWHLHHYGYPPCAPQGLAVGESLVPEVNWGAWRVVCPCGGSQIASPDHDRFFCIECLNERVQGCWVRVAWPPREARDAVEAALDPRPLAARNWDHTETVGVLLFDNHAHGLLDQANECVAGDIGYAQQKRLSAGPQTRALPVGAK